ncbi:MAG: hypothetical protein PHI12_03000 [Dehalococcoidales bacterium]|nr:hypothetical protein [Dehalococcoidales bacterium]
MKAKLILIVSLLLAGLYVTGCDNSRDFDDRLDSITKPYGFSVVAWECRTAPGEMVQWAKSWFDNPQETDIVYQYFDTVSLINRQEREIRAVESGTRQGDLTLLQGELTLLKKRKQGLENTVERIIEQQIKAVLAEEGIFNPLTGLSINFPPLNFSLERPPHLLVISPRDRIASIREILLSQDISVAEMGAIEEEAEELGVSALVVEIGGLGSTYPSFVTNEASLSFTIDAATEEWLHQYLFFKPLGILYTLDLTGLAPNYEIAVINETVASMTSKEIGAIVYQKYYARVGENGSQNPPDGSGFDFNREMREIRRTVDQYLSRGEIEPAEEFMEEKRQYLASMGYHIRKLNQAYFAFHGAYADSPTSIDPIGAELQKLREQSSSIKDFLDKAASITGRQDLTDILK